MDAQDEALITKLIDHNPELKTLVESHRDFERQLDEMYRRPRLSTEEDLQLKRLKKAKLAGKEKIELILAQHRA
ncbi:MAG: YdcH family protein [Deltaproteobacteria bacterium]|nr:YdcH family protein [Deltaproteobacteria bacterium]